MADKKRKPKSNTIDKSRKHKKLKNTNGNGGDIKKSTGPRLPAALRKELDNIRKPSFNGDNDSDFDDNVFVNGEEIDSDLGENKNDFYEYQEVVAEEESTKNRRYDPVDNFEYQLPDKFKDEDVLSEDDDIGGNDDGDDGQDDEDSDDDGRHARMLHDITGIPTEGFSGKRKRKKVVSEAYPESEFNPCRDVLSGDGQITIDDLLGPLRGTSGYSRVRNNIKRTEEKGIKIQAPLPKPDRERVERGTAYDKTKEDLTKWEGQVKRNREAPTLIFDQSNVIKVPTVGAIASGFKPRTQFEKTIASLMHDGEIVDAYQNDGTKLLEMNQISVEDVKERQERQAKMRSLLFHHEIKAKRISKIKSKTYHKIKKRDKMKAAYSDLQNDPEAERELAEKEERKRAEARMTLRHKNQGKWAKRILERGLEKQDGGTLAAVSEQLHQHNLLTRKMNSLKDDSSSDDSAYEDDEDSDSSEGASKLVTKAKEKTLKLMEQEDEVPDSGVMSLPFMLRGLEKRKEAASEEAKRALEEYDISLNQQDGNAAKHVISSGRRVFGATEKKAEDRKIKHRPEVDNYGSENEDINEEDVDVDLEHMKGSHLLEDVVINLDVLREDLETGEDSVLKCVNDITVEDPQPRTSYDVSVYASGSLKKMKSIKGKKEPTPKENAKQILNVAEPSEPDKVREEVDEDSDSDSGGHMVDGMLSAGAKQTYELPSNEELIRRAFAGDDVVEEFQKAKDTAYNEEIPEPEKPSLVPGWGQWTNVQKKRGLPSWISKEHEAAKRRREAALKKREDAPLKHVIKYEKIDKQAEKLYTGSLPYPFISNDVFEKSTRMPIGPEFNPATVAGALTRPAVLKKSGVIIPPISFKEVDPHEKQEDKKQGGKRRKLSGKKSGGR